MLGQWRLFHGNHRVGHKNDLHHRNNQKYLHDFIAVDRQRIILVHDNTGDN